jgi:hypothetical protein
MNAKTPRKELLSAIQEFADDWSYGHRAINSSSRVKLLVAIDRLEFDALEQGRSDTLKDLVRGLDRLEEERLPFAEIDTRAVKTWALNRLNKPEPPKSTDEPPPVGSLVYWPDGREWTVRGHWNGLTTQSGEPVRGFYCHEGVSFRMKDEGKTWLREKPKEQLAKQQQMCYLCLGQCGWWDPESIDQWYDCSHCHGTGKVDIDD